jgi:hypothetical protein
MKYPGTLLLFFALGTILSISACHKTPREVDKPEPIDIYHTLPEITQEGKNTFGCKVNGEVWVPRVELFVPWYTLDFQFSEADFKGVGNIMCRVLTEKQDEFMQIVFGPTYFSPGPYIQNLQQGRSTHASLRVLDDDYHSIDKDSTLNKVNVQFIDAENNIVSGTFEFKLYNVSDPGDTIRFSEGRFDLRY